MTVLDLMIAFIVTFVLLLSSVYKGVFLGYPLIVVLIFFFILALRRGYPPKDVIVMICKGGKKSFIVIKVFILIGAIIAIWMSSGTVPAMVYYGVKLIKPDLFLLCAFLISCFISFLIGTAVGTSGTAGVALMVIAKGANVSTAATAGAIIAGAYFGDRCSPMSAGANLIASVTETNIYQNIKNMFKTNTVPFALSIIFYFLISRIYPLHNTVKDINTEIIKVFNVNLIVLLPALIIIVFSAFKVNVKISMMVSIIIALLLSIVIQKETFVNCIRFIFVGYRMDNTSPLYHIIQGGGIISMLRTSFIILIASAFAGIIEGTEMLNSIENLTKEANSRYEIFKNVAITSIFTAAVGCSSVFAIILTHMLNKKAYEKNKIDNYCMAVDLENTATLISALIPWNVSLLLPMSILGTNVSCIPYSWYIYILPLWNLVFLKFGNHEPKLKTEETAN